MNKDEMKAQHDAEFNCRWKLHQIEQRIAQLQAQRVKAHTEWMRAKDATRRLGIDQVTPLPHSDDLVVPNQK